jgi:hypothetical protein
MRVVGPSAFANLGNISATRIGAEGANICKLLGETQFTRRQAEYIVEYEDLAIALCSGTDTNGGNRELRRDLCGQMGRYSLENDCKRSGLLDCVCIFEEPLTATGFVPFATALDLVSTHAVDALWRETNVTHDRDVGIGDRADRIGDGETALEFHCLCAGLDEAN